MGSRKNAECGIQISRSVVTVLESYGKMTSQSTRLAEDEETSGNAKLAIQCHTPNDL